MKSHWEKWQLLSAWHIRGKVEKSNDALNGFRNCNNINGTEDVSYSGPWVMVPISFAYLARFTKGLRCDFKLSWHEQIWKLCKVGMIPGDHQFTPLLVKKPQWRFSPNKTRETWESWQFLKIRKMLDFYKQKVSYLFTF